MASCGASPRTCPGACWWTGRSCTPRSSTKPRSRESSCLPSSGGSRLGRGRGLRRPDCSWRSMRYSASPWSSCACRMPTSDTSRSGGRRWARSCRCQCWPRASRCSPGRTLGASLPGTTPDMHAYLDLMRQVRERGTRKTDRTGTGTLSLFGRQLRFDLSAGFPLVTTKRVHLRSVIEELLWFLRGETNVRSLQDKGVTIWDEWADEQGELGPVYGRQWRAWATADGGHVDQVARAIHQLRNDPDSRRILVSAWNVGELDRMALAPCHAFFQCYVADGRLSLQVYQRSCDIFLGVPFNLASYALLTHILAQQADLKVGELVWTGGDCHLYLNHIEQADTQLTRTPSRLPTLALLRRPADFTDYRFEDFQVLGYDPQPAIRATVAV